KTGATPRSASAAPRPQRQLSDEELEPEEISDPNRSTGPAKHDIRFVPQGEKQTAEPQVSVAATGKPRPGSPQKTAGDKPEREPKTGSRIKGIDQDQRDRHGPDHLSYDSEIGPYTGKEKKEPTTDGSMPTQGPLKAKSGEPVADEDADFNFKPKAYDQAPTARAATTPKDAVKVPLKAKPGEAISDEDADFPFAPKADDKAKSRPTSPSQKSTSAAAPATRPQIRDDDHMAKAPLRAKPGEAIADEDADFAFKPTTANKPKSRSSSPSKKSRPITPRIVIDEPEDEVDADYTADLKKPIDRRPKDSKTTGQPTRSKPPTGVYDDEEQEPESLNDDITPARKHDVSFKSKPSDKPTETGKDDSKAPPRMAKPAEPTADEDADFTFKPSLVGKPTSKPTPTGATQPLDSDEELEPELIDDASGAQKKPSNDVKFKPPQDRTPSDAKKAPTKLQPEEPLADEDADFTFKPKDADKKAPAQTAPKVSEDAAPNAKRSLEDASKKAPKTTLGEPDENAEFTIKPKPEDKAKAPSMAEKPLETAGQQAGATGEPSGTPFKPKHGDTVPDEDAEYTFKPKSADKAPPRSPSPTKEPVGTGTDAQQPPGDRDAIKPRSSSPSKKPASSTGKPQAVSKKPQDSDEELEPELVDEGPTAKTPAHDVKLKPAEAKKPTDEAKVPSKTDARPSPKAGGTPAGDANIADKAKPRSPSPAKKPVVAGGQPKAAVSQKPADSDEELEPELVDSGPPGKKPDHDVKLKQVEAKKPLGNEKVTPKTADKPAGKPGVSPQAGVTTENARPTPRGNMPDEDAEFSFKPSVADKSKPRSPSPTKKPVSSKAVDKRPVDSDEELEPELVDEGPTGKAPGHDVKLRPAEAKKPTEDAKAAAKTAAKPAAKKPDEIPQDANKPLSHPTAGDAVPDEDADFTFKPKGMDKPKPRSPSPAKKPTEAPVPSKASSKTPSSDDELEPELIDAGPVGARPSHDIKFKKPVDSSREAPTPAAKPTGKTPIETPQDAKRPVIHPEERDDVPDEDADFTFQPKPVDKAKPRSPSPAKKPSAAPAEAKKPADDAKAPPSTAPKPGVNAGERPEPGRAIPDEDADFTFQPKPVHKAKPRSPSPAKKPSAAPAEVKKPTDDDAKAPPSTAPKPGVKAGERPEPGRDIPEENSDFTFQQKPVDKAKPRSPSPAKKPSAALAEVKKPTDDAKAPPSTAPKPGVKAGERPEPGRAIPDEDADFTFQPKPVDKAKPRSPSPAKKPSAAPAEVKKPTDDDAKAPPPTAPKPGVKAGERPEPGRAIPDEDADFTFQPKPVEKVKPRSPSPAKKSSAAPAEAKKPVDDAKAPPKSAPGPQIDKAKAPPQPAGVIPDEDADFTFKPKLADKTKSRSPSPAKKPTNIGGQAKPSDKMPTESDEELEPELLDTGPRGKKPVHDVKYKPDEGAKPAETEKPVLKPVPKPVPEAKEPVEAAASEKPKDIDTPLILGKLPERRTKTPLEKLEKFDDVPKQPDAKKPAETEKPAEPKKTGGLVKEIGPDGKTRWVKSTPERKLEAKKPADEAKEPAKTAPGTAPKPPAKPGDASKGLPQGAPRKAEPGDVAPEEDADFTFKPKQEERAKPRTPSPAKKPTAADTKPAKPKDGVKPDPTKAPVKVKPAAAVPDEDADFTFKPKPAEKPKQASGKPSGTDEELEPDLLDGPGQKPPHDVKFKPAEAKKPVEEDKHAPKAAPKPAAAKPGEPSKAPSKATPGPAVPDEDADFTFKPKPKAAAKKPVGSDEEMEPDLLDGASGQKPPHDVKFKPPGAKKPVEEAKVPPKAAPKPMKPAEGAKDEPKKPDEAAEPKKTGGLVKELGPDGKVRWVKPTPEPKEEAAKLTDQTGKPPDAAKKAPTKPRDVCSEPKVAPKAAPKPGAQPAAGAKEPAKAPLKLKPGELDNDQDADATLPLKPATAKPAVTAPGKQPKPRDSSADPKAATKAAAKPSAKPAIAAKEPLKLKPGEPTTDENADATLPLKPSGGKPAAATAKPTAPKAAAKPGEAPKPPSSEAPKVASKPGDAAKTALKPADVPKAKGGEPQKAPPKPGEEPKAASKPGEAPKAQPAAVPKLAAKPGEAPKAAPKPEPKAAAAKPGEALKPTAKPGETPKAQTATVPKPAAKPGEAPKTALKPVAAPTAAGPAKEDGPQKEEEKPSVLDKLPERGKKTPLEKYVPFKPPEEKPSVLDSLPEKMQKTPLEKYIPLGGPEAAKPDGKPKYDPLKYLPEKKLEAVPKKTGGLIKEIGPDGKVKWVKPPPEPKPEPPPKKAAPRKVTVIPEEPVEDVDAEANLPLGKKDGKKPADKEAKPDDKDAPQKGTKRKPGEEKDKDEEPHTGDEDMDDEEEGSDDEDMEVDGAKPKKGKKKAKKPKKGGADESDDDESDEDEESDADDSDGPHRKKAKKKPKKGKKSKKKGDNEESEPSDEDADFTFKPKRKKKKPADEDGSDDDDEDRPSKRRKKRKLKKKKPKKEKKEKAPKEPPPKRRWVPPPRPVEVVVAPPPDEKRLCDILREEKINPIKHYAKKPNHIETAIPFVIPWEQSAALVTQEGMGAFGTPRHNAIHIDDGHVELKQGALKSDTVLPLWEDHYRHSETQKGMTSFGSHKKNVGNVIDHHKYESDTKLNLCEGVIPRHALGSLATQQDMTPIGALRTQKMNVKYKENMTEGFDKKGNAFLSRQMQPNSTEHAGSHIMDRRRGIVPATEGKEIKMTHERASDGIIPLLFTTDFIDKRSGADFGSFRPTIHEDEGGFPMTFDDEIRCKAVIPFQTAPGLVNGRY
ncbi:I-connectin, partial [Aphelenchoides avenae]